MTARVLVAGVGNEFRGDDAAGLIVARQIVEKHISGVEVIEATGEGGRLIEAWTGYGGVILVDAMRSGSPAGAIRRVDVSSTATPAYFRHRSTHAISVIDAIETARALGRLPARVVLFGIEGSSFSAGDDLSPEVQRAVPEAVKAVLAAARKISDAEEKAHA